MLIAEYNDSKYSIPTLKTMYASGSILDKTYYKAHRTLYFLNIYHVYSLSENAPMVIAKGRIVWKSLISFICITLLWKVSIVSLY